MTTLGALAVVVLAQAAAVEGVVRSSDDGAPVAYAQVRVAGDSITDWTDQHGRYRLDGLAPGRWQLQVAHTAHDSLALDVFVPGDRGVRLDITLDARPSPTPEALHDFEPFQVDFTIPALLNPGEITRLIQQRYPTELVDRGVGGEAVLRLWLDERGQVVRGELSSSSGITELDTIALAVTDRMRFRPARTRDQAVRVIVRFPVSLRVPPEEVRLLPDSGR